MTTAGQNPSSDRRLTDTQLAEVMRLVKGANSVELKLTVPASAHRATVQGLPIDPVESQPRQVYFFDTPDLALYRAGVVVRARRIQGGRGDTVVKLRPVEPDDIPQDLKNAPSFNIEVDALPVGFVCSASFKGRTNGQNIRDAVGGNKRLSKIFSKPQRAFYKLHAPAGIELGDLQPLGPTFILKGRFSAMTAVDAKAAPRSLVAEMWLYPDGSRILELSTKCAPNDALGAAAEMRAYLVSKNVPTNAAQETKTYTALQFYSAALQTERAAQAAEDERAARRSNAAAGNGATATGSSLTSASANGVAKPTAAKATAAKSAAAKSSSSKTAAAAAKTPTTSARRATQPSRTPAKQS